MRQAFKTIKKSPPEVPCFSLARVFRESDLSALCSVYSESRNSRNAIMIQGEDLKSPATLSAMYKYVTRLSDTCWASPFLFTSCCAGALLIWLTMPWCYL